MDSIFKNGTAGCGGCSGWFPSRPGGGCVGCGGSCSPLGAFPTAFVLI